MWTWIRRAACVAMLGATASAPMATLAGAQQPSTIVRVRVVDSAGVPLPNADVRAMLGVTTTLASATSDASGTARLTVPRRSEELEIVARHVGYQRGDHFFRTDRDSLSLVVTLRAGAQTLPAMQVTASEDLKRKRYHVSADDIAEANRPIRDALDVVTKLRPTMMDPPTTSTYAPCGLYYIWVNGKRIVYPPVEASLAIKTYQERRAKRLAANGAAGRAPTYSGQMTVPVTVQTTLARIRPEHIEEMNYVDCTDTQATDMVRGQNALFVVLKPGIGFDPLTGSYVLDAGAAAEPSAEVPAAVPAFRHRLLGVFDELSGEPIANVEVVDLSTGTFARTTATGTASLLFLPEGLSTIELRHPDHATLRLDVSITPRDTVPLTLLLAPKPR